MALASTGFHTVYLLCKEDPVEHMSTSLKITDEAGTQHQDTYDEPFFYMIYKIYLSHNYCIEKSAVQVYISLSF
jgi:hypothetical protein